MVVLLCSSLRWSDNTTNVPSDCTLTFAFRCNVCFQEVTFSLAPPLIIETISPALVGIAISIRSLGFLASLVAIFLLIKWRETKPIFAMGGLFNMIILSGLMLVFITVILMALDLPTTSLTTRNGLCFIRPWFLGTSYIWRP
jgi:hypothetical protein